MSTIRKGNVADAQSIIDIANATWPVAYQFINNQEQIDYMLALFYNIETLNAQLSDAKQLFYLYQQQDGQIIGYAHAYATSQQYEYYLSKLYVLPNAQGAGAGKQLLSYLENYLQSIGAQSLSLNVNRRNPAVAFYTKCGFVIRESVDIPLHKYILDDYVMHKELNTKYNTL